MFRYFAFLWDRTNLQSAANGRLLRDRLHNASSHKWTTALDIEGLCVLYAGTRPNAWNAHLLASHSGVVLGTLFKPNGAAATLLDGENRFAIVETAGRHLVDRFWGRYVAFIRDPRDAVTHVVRDPQGGLPCFFTKLHDLLVFYSDIEDLLVLEVIRPTINLRFLRSYICLPMLTGDETGLNEIKEVPPGHCLRVDLAGEISSRCYWDPAAIARSPLGMNEKEVAAALRSTTETCVAAWASCYPRILHRLSGGLDSSIVLSCLRSAPAQPEVTCLNYFFNSENEDERTYARMASSAFQCKLVEKEEVIADVRLESILNIRKLPRPSEFEEPARHAAFETQLATERDAQALFSGVGGDNIFYQSPLTLTSADYLHGRLTRKGFLKLVTLIAQREREPVWKVLGEVMRSTFRPGRWNPLEDATRFMMLVTPEAVEATIRQQDYIHPSLRNPKGLPPGKLRHIQMMTALVPDPFSPFHLENAPEHVAPLISQPLIELCLRIPTYVLSAHGVDRSAIRQAFEGAVPSPILRRHDKSGIDAYLLQLLHKNLPFVRELMLDGLLVKEGLLDRKRLEKALALDQPWTPPEGLEVLCDHLSTEVWLRSWRA